MEGIPDLSDEAVRSLWARASSARASCRYGATRARLREPGTRVATPRTSAAAPSRAATFIVRAARIGL